MATFIKTFTETPTTGTATATITITSATNPTYGGYIQFDDPAYSREALDSSDSVVSFDGSRIKRIFTFFDLSTDPTSGGTITKVELLATVSSVSGTHAVDYVGGSEGMLNSGTPSSTDDRIYDDCGTGSTTGNSYLTNQATTAGAIAVDLGAQAILDVSQSRDTTNFYLVGICLTNEAATGSVVFDAAAGFGLRITYTTSVYEIGSVTYDADAAPPNDYLFDNAGVACGKEPSVQQVTRGLLILDIAADGAPDPTTNTIESISFQYGAGNESPAFSYRIVPILGDPTAQSDLATLYAAMSINNETWGTNPSEEYLNEQAVLSYQQSAADAVIGFAYVCNEVDTQSASMTGPITLTIVYQPAATVNTITLPNPNTSTFGVDTWISSAAPTTNNGTDSNLYVNKIPGDEARILIAFDPWGQSSIPHTGIVYTQATLRLGLNLISTVAGGDIEIRSLMAAFVGNEATWNKRNTATNWSAAGGDFNALLSPPNSYRSSWGNGYITDFEITAAANEARIANVSSDGKLYFIIKMPSSATNESLRFASVTNSFLPHPVLELSWAETGPTGPGFGNSGSRSMLMRCGR